MKKTGLKIKKETRGGKRKGAGAKLKYGESTMPVVTRGGVVHVLKARIMKDKLEQVDEILAQYEDWMHGTDGDNCTKARKLLNEVMVEVKNISFSPLLSGQPEMAQNPVLNAVPFYEGECLSWLKSLPDKCCDIWTDPPYNVGKDYGVWNDSMPDAEYLEWITAVLIECKRVANVFTVYVPKKWQLHYWNVLGSDWQEIILTYNQEGAIRSGFVNQFNKLFTNANPKAHKKYIKNVWHNIRDRSHGYYFTEETFGHPGYTSELLSRKVILDLCVSDIICDPFMGTGTTAVAAIKSGKDFIGCEINPEYCRIAKKRIEAVRSQPVLFEDGRHYR